MTDFPNVKIMRPTITLALIAKNEEKNLPRLFASIEGCFDEVILVDTGSTDKTRSMAIDRGCKVFDFTWVDDFSAARNFAFSKATCDFIAWADLDDVLVNPEGFIKWRDHAMAYVDYWMATYDYAHDAQGKPAVSFVRERVVRRSLNPKWSYALHEGIMPHAEWSRNYATPWKIKHCRDEEDIKADRSRNIGIFERKIIKGDMDGRMYFYYGKELFEIGRPAEAIPAFEKALGMPLEAHDRLLSLQYGAYSAMAVFDQTKDEFGTEKERLFNKTLEFAHQGLRLDPNRAEFYVIIGDAFLRIKNLVAAVPYFASAKHCLKSEGPHASAIYSFSHLYGEAPNLQLAKIYAHLGLLDKAKAEAKECVEKYNNEEAKSVLIEIERINQLVNLDAGQEQTSDIVISTPPQNAYPFDEEIYKTKPLGGSETALVQMARLLKEKTGRRVIVFNQRAEPLTADSGVEYVSNARINEYFSKFRPAAHVAWRHNVKLTNAPTYLWCHDLFTPGVETKHNFDKFLALSPFHKNYTMGLQGVPSEKIVVTRNGIDPKKFQFERKPKNPNKVVWLSSLDRGLDRAIGVLDLVRESVPNLELHVYYGWENLYNYGPVMSALADKLKKMVADRPWIKYHGFTEQNKMYQEVSDAVVWCHPNNFIETYAITAIECLANGIYPVVRRLGALGDTLKEAELKGHATLVDYAWDDPDAIYKHAQAVIDAIRGKKWEGMTFDLEANSWSRIADAWIEMMSLEVKALEAAS